MLIAILFPIADSRAFLEVDTRVLSRPLWPDPNADEDFVRSFGIIRQRWESEVYSAVSENKVCDARHALRFDGLRAYLDSGSGLRVPLRIAYRTFYFDGLAVGKFEVGLVTPSFWKISKAKISSQQIEGLFHHFLHLPVVVPNPKGEPVKSQLWQAGKHLAKLYAFSSSKTAIATQVDAQKWWVQACKPVLLVEQRQFHDDNIDIPFRGKSIHLRSAADLNLFHHIISNQGTSLNMWRILRPSLSVLSKKSKELGIFLLRLHTERECLKRILENIASDRIEISPRSKTSDLLQSYLNSATKWISRLQGKTYSPSGDEVDEIARDIEDFVAPGEREAILRILRNLDIRKNIYRKVEHFVHQQISQKENLNDLSLSADSFILHQRTLQTEKLSQSERSSKSNRVIKILFLAANPQNTARLRLDEEIRSIDQALRQAEFRDNFDIRQHWAVRVIDLQSYLLRHKPDIVHFSGHGSISSEIVLEDNDGNSQPISNRALSNLFSVLKDNIRCVVLNACYSAQQARAIADHIDCVIGMSKAIGDLAAINFAGAFYQALGYGRDVKTAFELGRGLIDLQTINEENTPKLLAINSPPEKIRFVEL